MPLKYSIEQEQESNSILSREVRDMSFFKVHKLVPVLHSRWTVDRDEYPVAFWFDRGLRLDKTQRHLLCITPSTRSFNVYVVV